MMTDEAVGKYWDATTGEIRQLVAKRQMFWGNLGLTALAAVATSALVAFFLIVLLHQRFATIVVLFIIGVLTALAVIYYSVTHLLIGRRVAELASDLLEKWVIGTTRLTAGSRSQLYLCVNTEMIPLGAKSTYADHPDLVAACNLAHLPPMTHSEWAFSNSLLFPFECDVKHSDGTTARVKMDVVARLSDSASPDHCLKALGFPGNLEQKISTVFADWLQKIADQASPSIWLPGSEVLERILAVAKPLGEDSPYRLEFPGVTAPLPASIIRQWQAGAVPAINI